MEKVKYFIYVRKSTRQDDRQALSIQGQLGALHKLIREHGLNVVGEIIERDSAHAPGRPLFGSMMTRIENGEADGIIAWHPNRLARNSLDGGKIIHFLDVRILNDLKFPTFWFESTPQGKANLGHEFVSTKQFSDALGCDTKRGLREKAGLGFYPGPAPRGYLNNRATKKLVVDPVLAPIIRKGFEIYSKGNLTIEEMRKYFARNGIFTNPNSRWQSEGGGLVHQDWIRRFLRNPIYYGHFEYDGELFEGKHQPIISKTLFDRVQTVLATRTCHHKPRATPKAFVGLFHCGACGMMITAEIKKGHTYYRCTRKSREIKCTQKFLREEELNRQISDLLKVFHMDSKQAEQMLRKIALEEREIIQSSHEALQENRDELAKLREQEHKLLSLYTDPDQMISREEYLEHKRTLLTRKKQIQENLKHHETSRCGWLEPFRDWITMAQRAAEIANAGTPKEKKALARLIFGSNLTIIGQRALGKAVKPWSLIIENASLPHQVRLYETARMHFRNSL